ncbi:MAG TPA: long-chain-fatty-acid--CoA ligase [Nocardioidaceae bacterium]|nr:long-chain-fatty-acid--CoA ligase [Nocardioidaceae bacterium]
MYLTQGLHRSVQQTPDEVMTIFGDRTRTFREVADRVARLAGALTDLGVGSGDRVAILSLNSDRYHECLLAIPWADAVMTPVNIRWSAAEVAYSLEDSESKVLVVDDTFAAMLPALRERYPALKTVIHAGEGSTPEGCLSFEELVAAASPIEDARRSGDELAGIFYTGGTTGLPKGVMLSHTNMVTQNLGFMASRAFLGAGTRFLHAAPMFHLADLAGWGGQVLLGGTHVIVPAFDPVAVAKAIEQHRVTDVLLVPTMIQVLVDHPAVKELDLSSLERVVYGASTIPEALLRRAMSTLPQTSFIQGYGMTELAAVATILGADEHRAGGRLLRSAGRAAPHVELRIVDEAGATVPAGTVGEVTVSGPNVMLGYWNRPEETAAALRGGWMHTGDGGYLDEEGYLFIVDRLKDMIVTGGENVYSAEVENAIASHPAVASCAVIGVPDEEWGERVHAVVVCRPDQTVSLDELRAHTKDLIASYKAPRGVDVVEALPVSAAGKILKRELRERYRVATPE